MIEIVSWPMRFEMDPRKIMYYLLDPASDDGASKGNYLTSYGFDASRPHELGGALIQHASRTNFLRIKVAPFGLKFLYDGPLPSPNGLDATVLTVLQVDAGGDGTARFITTRPSRRRK